MALFRVYAPHQVNDVQIPTWNGTIRPGDDLKVALTLLQDDGETPAIVAGATAQMALYPSGRPGPWLASWDYGMGSFSSWSRPMLSAAGFVVDEAAGRINFYFPASTTATLATSVDVFISIDVPSGISTVVQGTIRVQRPMDTLPHRPTIFFQIGVTPIGRGRLAGATINNVPVDADGFPLLIDVPMFHVVSVDPTSSILGVGVLGQMILAPGGAFANPYASSQLGIGVLGQMILAA